MNVMFIFAVTYATVLGFLMLELNKYVLMGIAVVLIAILVSSKTEVLKTIFLASILSFALFNTYNYFNVNTDYSRETCDFKAEILQNPINYDEYSRVLAEVSIENQKFKSYLYFDDVKINAEISDRVEGSAYFYQPNNKNGFNAENYYKSDGIFLLGSVESYEISENDKFSMRKFIGDINSKIKSNIDVSFDEQDSGFVKSLILGDKTDFNGDFKLDVYKAGISHILVVSGLHIGYLVMLCFVVFGRKYGNYFAILAIIFFFFVVGYTPSIMRASIMCIILIIADLFSLQYSKTKSIWFAFTIILMLNPYSILDVGFILSFASSAGIIYFYQPIYDKIKTKSRIFNKAIVQSFCVSLSVSITATLPLLIYFDAISSIVIISNIVILPIIAMIFALCIPFILCSFISLKLAPIIAFPISIMIDIVRFLTHKLASFKFSQVATDSPILYIMALAIIVLFMISYYKHGFLKISIPFSISLYFLAMFYVSYSDYNSVITTIFPVSDGQAVLVTYKDEVTLIDCGSTRYADASEKINEYLYKFGYDEIDNFVVTSIDSGHIRDILRLDVPVLNIITPQKAVRNDANEKLNEFILQSGAKSTLNLPDYIKIITKDEKKLAVLINNSTLTLHSFTNKMMEEFLSDNNIKAENIILADKVLEEYKILKKHLDLMEINTVFLSNDYEKLTIVSERQAYSTIEYGEIKIKEDLWEN